VYAETYREILDGALKAGKGSHSGTFVALPTKGFCGLLSIKRILWPPFHKKDSEALAPAK